MSPPLFNDSHSIEKGTSTGFLMVESIRGGELKFMEGLSRHYLTPIKVVYDRNEGKLDTSVRKTVKISIVLLSKIFPAHKHGIAATISTLGMRLRPDNRRWFVSSSVSIPPKASRMLLYVHTPPRIFTSEYSYYLDFYKKTSPIIALFLPFLRAVFNKLYGKSLRKASVVVCNSVTVQKRIKGYYDVDAVVLNPFVSIDDFSPGSFENYFLFVSRYEPLKNHMFVIKAFEQFYMKRGDFKLVIVGANSIDKAVISYIDNLRSYVDKHNLPVEFFFNESQERINELYKNCYSVLFSAKNEDFGYIIIEGMACGKPVISINEGGPSEIIQNGENGYLVKSSEEMKEKMLYLTENEIELNRISVNARKTAIDHYSPSVFFARLDDLINSV